MYLYNEPYLSLTDKTDHSNGSVRQDDDDDVHDSSGESLAGFMRLLKKSLQLMRYVLTLSQKLLFV